jgi:hypothetical protein
MTSAPPHSMMRRRYPGCYRASPAASMAITCDEFVIVVDRRLGSCKLGQGSQLLGASILMRGRMSDNGKRNGLVRRIVGWVLALCGTFGLIVKGASDIWSVDQIAAWVASAVRTLSASLAWQLSILLAVVGFVLIFVSSRAASALTKSISTEGMQRIRHAGVLTLIAAFVLGIVGSRHATTNRVMTATGPAPTPETAPPVLPGSPGSVETQSKHAGESATNHTPVQGSSQAPLEDVSYQSSNPAAIAASTEPATPTATDASYSEPAPSNEEPEAEESGTESTTSTTIYENTSTTASTSSTSAESTASASSSVSVTGGEGGESIVDSSQSASSSSESSASSSASVSITESSETTES